MVDSPYTEGWPKWSVPMDTDRERQSIQIVPLSDAERLRETLERVREKSLGMASGPEMRKIIDPVLNPERGE